MSDLLRAPAEIKYAEELDWLESIDDNPKPFSWRLSPKMVRLFILGSERADGLDREIPQKWFGDRSFVERSIVTLASDRGLLLIGGSSLLFSQQVIGPYSWMLTLGTGLFLTYIPIQMAIFERLIALFKMKANAGFFVYACDATGYLGSVGLMLYREFFMKDLRWSKVLMQFSYVLCFASLGLLLLSVLFFNRKQGILRRFQQQQPTPPAGLQNITVY